MQILKTLSLTVLLSAAAITTSAQVNPQTATFIETQPKTIVIKHPLANNPANYFSMSPMYNFEVFKPGDINKIVAEMAKDPDVLSARVGGVNGDYSMINLTLKSTKDKTWFTTFFKNAGIKMVKFNNSAPVEVEKM